MVEIQLLYVNVLRTRIISDCLRGYFEIQQRNRTKTGYPNCTTPWHQSILEGGSYTRANTKSCNETEKQKQLKLIETFMKNSGSFRIEQCPGQCACVSVRVGGGINIPSLIVDLI